MAQEIVGMGLYSGLVTKVNLYPKDQPFLYDHEINGTPVLPGVMGVEAMVEATKLLFPDLYLSCVEEVDFFAPFKFYHSQPRDVMIRVYFNMDNQDVIGNCELFGSRKLFGKEVAEIKTHFKAKVRLSARPPVIPKPVQAKLSTKGKKAVAESKDIYQLYFHGPAYQVIDKSWKLGDDVVGQFNKALPHNHHPKEFATQALPRLIELCFQTAGLWEMGADNRMGLPMHFDSLMIYKQPAKKGINLYTLVSRAGGGYDAKVVNSKGEVYLHLKGYTTAEFNSDIDEKLLAPLKAVVE
jgi:hypothetical protein